MIAGINHTTAPVALREQFAIPARALPEALGRLRDGFGLPEAVLLSTCNRVELYAEAPDRQDAFNRIDDFLSFISRLAPEHVTPHRYRYAGAAAARHLFQVAAGLDSMVLGESEIIAQVKHAYQASADSGMAGPGLHRLFQKALHTAKLVRTRTALSQGCASIGSVVVSLASGVFGGLRDRQVLLWGAGKAAHTTAQHLTKAGISRLWVVSRRNDRAQALAEICQAGWLSWERAAAQLDTIDIIIVCTQAPHYVVEAEELARVMRARAGRPLLVVDLSVPRNVDPAVSRLPGVLRYDMDALQALTERSLATRRDAVAASHGVIDRQVAHLMRPTVAGPRAYEETTCVSVS